MTCICSLAGTAACASCSNNPNSAKQYSNFITWTNSAERTCEFNIKDNMNETEGMGDVWIECSACHCMFDYYADEWLMKMSYCPNCGARVIKSDQYL